MRQTYSPHSTEIQSGVSISLCFLLTLFLLELIVNMSWAVQTHAPCAKAPLLFTHWWLWHLSLLYSDKVQKCRRPLMPVESLGTLNIQPASLPAFVIPWLLHQYSGDRKTWKCYECCYTCWWKKKEHFHGLCFRHTHKPATANELHWFSVAVFRGLVCDFIHR